MTDMFSNFTAGLNSPPSNLTEVIPDNATDLPYASRSINVATSGTVRVTTVRGDTATLFVAAGIAFPVRATRIWSTQTSATGIVVMY